MASVRHASHELILIASATACLARRRAARCRARMNVTVIVEQADGASRATPDAEAGRYTLRPAASRMQTGPRSHWGGAQRLRQALVNLEAVPAPAGSMTVVLGPGVPGVCCTTAHRHGLEGDVHRKGTSAFSGRIGERVRGPGLHPLSMMAPWRRVAARSNIDDEGTPTQCTTLIEDGVLCAATCRIGSMHGSWVVRSTGNGRRESSHT